MIYLDNAATTKMHVQVMSAMIEAMEVYGNPSSVHPVGAAARELIEKSRETIAAAINAEAKQIFFTSGATEANNTVDFILFPPIVSAIEHKSVLILDPMFVVPVCKNGVIDLDFLTDEFMKKRMVSVMAANNETGIIQPIEAVCAMAHEKSCLFHTDAVQYFGKMPVDVKKLDVDFMSISAHKLHGPKGVGAIYAKEPKYLKRFIYGGNQERGKRAGTENLIGIVGFAEAAKVAVEQLSKNATLMRDSRDYLETELKAALGEDVQTDDAERVPHVLNVRFRNVDSEALLLLLSDAGICASNGSACESGSEEPSHVLRAMDVGSEWINGAVRFSTSRYTTMAEVEEAAQETINAVKSLINLRGVK